MKLAVWQLIGALIVAAPGIVRGDVASQVQDHVARAQAFHDAGQFSEASHQLALAYTLDPRPELLYALGQVFTRLDQCGPAITFYRRFLATRPDDSAAASTAQAIAHCKKTQPEARPASAPSLAQQHIATATEHHAAGDFARARDALATAYALEPRAELLYGLGQVHVKLDQCAPAITFYERFITETKREDDVADARQAIETCKTKLAAPPPAPPSPPPPSPAPRERPAAQVATQPAPRYRWYRDKPGLALIAGGAAVGITSALFYRSALGDLDAADQASTYADHADLALRADRKRGYAVGLGLVAAGVASAGIVKMVLTHRSQAIAIVPDIGGGMMAWGGRF